MLEGKRRIVYMPNPKYDVNVPDNELPVTADKISFICNKSEPLSEVTIKPDMRENEITGCDNCRFRIR